MKEFIFTKNANFTSFKHNKQNSDGNNIIFNFKPKKNIYFNLWNCTNY